MVCLYYFGGDPRSYRILPFRLQYVQYTQRFIACVAVFPDYGFTNKSNDGQNSQNNSQTEYPSIIIPICHLSSTHMTIYYIVYHFEHVLYAEYFSIDPYSEAMYSIFIVYLCLYFPCVCVCVCCRIYYFPGAANQTINEMEIGLKIWKWETGEFCFSPLAKKQCKGN